MENINDILSSVGIETPITSEPETYAIQPLTAETFNEALSEMGFLETVAPEEESQETETADLEPSEVNEDVDETAESETEEQEEESGRDVGEEEVNTLTPNSPTLLIDVSTSRFSGTEWYNEIQKQRIILAGLGGIGSWLALQLARMNPTKLVLYDDDVVELANMSGQMYGNSSIDTHKVNAILENITQFTNAKNVYAISEKFTPNSEAGDIMMCGFDSMRARKMFFDAWRKYVETKPENERWKCLYLDGRLSIDTLQVFCISGDDSYNINRYAKEFLFYDYQADNTVCSMKQTTYLACMIGSFMVNVFTNWVAQSLNPIIPYDVPFFTEYDAQNMIFKTEN